MNDILYKRVVRVSGERGWLLDKKEKKWKMKHDKGKGKKGQKEAQTKGAETGDNIILS